MKKILGLIAGYLLFGFSCYAAEGDLIVNGNVGVGTKTPEARLEVNGNIIINVNGARFTFTRVNGAEDSYSRWVMADGVDSCDGNEIAEYVCAMEDRKTCTDMAFEVEGWANYALYKRQVVCQRGAALVEIP